MVLVKIFYTSHKSVQKIINKYIVTSIVNELLGKEKLKENTK